MKMRNIYRSLLSVILAFSLTVPAFAAEGETVSPVPPVSVEQVPETPEEAAEPPEDGEQTTEPSETPETPDASEGPDGPDQPETPEAPEEPEVPEIPETPSEPETPVTPEAPPAPEVPVTPESPVTPPVEDPAQPPAWIPVLPPEQVPPVTRTPAEAPIQTPQAEVPVIDVVVPNTGAVIINPYGLPVEMDGQETTEQIAGSTMLLENRSNVAVDVSVNAVGIAQGGVVFATEPPAGSTLEKEVFLYAEFHATEALGQTVPWQDFFSDAPNQILVTPYGSNKDGVMHLEAVETPYSYGAARLFGSVSSYPAHPWEAGDGFHVNLAFTFTPVTPEAPILDAPSGTGIDSNLVLPAAPSVVPDWIIPSEPVVEPEPVVTPDPVIIPDPVVTPEPIETSEPTVPSETVPDTVPDESTAPIPDIP